MSKKQQQKLQQKQQEKLRQKQTKQERKDSGGQAGSSECPQCQQGPEFYRMLFGQYKFDVDLAREIVADGRTAIEMHEDDVAHALKWAEIHRPHLAHVNTDYPGIIAHYWYPSPEGELLHGSVLIDGHHRAAKLHESQQAFFAHLLSEDESKSVTMRSPLGSQKQLEVTG